MKSPLIHGPALILSAGAPTAAGAPTVAAGRALGLGARAALRSALLLALAPLQPPAEAAAQVTSAASGISAPGASAGARASADASAGWAGEVVLEVPAGASVQDPVRYPPQLAAGDRLVIDASGRLAGAGEREEGDIPGGALVGSFAGGPPFLVGTGRLLWTAPSTGKLAFAVQQEQGRRLTGGYSVRVLPLGPRGDPRELRFSRPRIAFLPRLEGGPFLELRYEDPAGFGLDLKTLQVFLDTEGGGRVVLSPYVRTSPNGAVLPALPVEVALPPGVHRVRATIGDALGNVSLPAEIFLDQP